MSRKRKTPRRRPEPRRRKPAAKKKTVVKALKRSIKAVIASTVPNPAKDAFLVFHNSGLAYLANGNNGEPCEQFTLDVTRARLFTSKDEAQGFIDGALVLAEAGSPFHEVEIVKASVALVPHYIFDLVDGEYLLSVHVKPKGDEAAVPFAKAKTLVAKALADATRDLAAKTNAFKRRWG